MGGSDSVGLNFSPWVCNTETPQDYSHFVFANVFGHLLCARLRAGSETGLRHLEQDTAPPSNSSQVWLMGRGRNVRINGETNGAGHGRAKGKAASGGDQGSF